VIAEVPQHPHPTFLPAHLASSFALSHRLAWPFVNGAVNHGHPDMLINMTNDAWFGDTTEPWIHLALAQIEAAVTRGHPPVGGTERRVARQRHSGSPFSLWLPRPAATPLPRQPALSLRWRSAIQQGGESLWRESARELAGA
jgi:hypothetical protein